MNIVIETANEAAAIHPQTNSSKGMIMFL